MWIRRDGVLGCAGFRQVGIASVSPADIPVSPADSANGAIERTIRLILLFFNKLDIMAYILLFFWIEGHDKRRPKGTCFKYPTWSERRREIDQLLGIVPRRPKGLKKEVHYEKADEAQPEAQPEGRFRVSR